MLACHVFALPPFRYWEMEILAANAPGRQDGLRADRLRICRIATAAVVLLLVPGCGKETAQGGLPLEHPPSGAYGDASYRDAIEFRDEVSTNTDVPEAIDQLAFTDTMGRTVAMKDYLGSKNVLLVFTKGFAGMLCPFCKTQTSRLIANYDRFAELETEVLVVYPGPKDHLNEFIDAAKNSGSQRLHEIPFPLVLDEELKAVNFFNIASHLADPSTFVIDKSGSVRLAYVSGNGTTDRPSVDALLEILRQANQGL